MLLKNIFTLLISALLATALSLLLNYYTPLVSASWLQSIIYFSVLCFAFNLVYAARAGTENFTQLLMASITIRLLLALIVIVIYSFNKQDFFNFAIHFISHYILFTIFEIRYLLQLIKKKTS